MNKRVLSAAGDADAARWRHLRPKAQRVGAYVPYQRVRPAAPAAAARGHVRNHRVRALDMSRSREMGADNDRMKLRFRSIGDGRPLSIYGQRQTKIIGSCTGGVGDVIQSSIRAVRSCLSPASLKLLRYVTACPRTGEER
ncbi:hypothetical protein EVAR_52158_1 [Eumeta japonica]|uniref:Uncharacterized protein n=1 Tax=Eumeta variegata TaxID=151549 RepID=A0A4C1Y8U2_EUMVA|nr:hypothetical protein EVAR_52158_1 [Eumeta japonica]